VRIAFAKEHPKKTAAIILLDLLFHLLFYPIAQFSLTLFGQAFNRFPMDAMAVLMNTPQGMEQIYEELFKIIVGMMLAFLLFLLLILANIAIFKILVWTITLKKDIKWHLIGKSLILALILGSIMVLPFIASIIPILSEAAKATEYQIQPQIGLATLAPLLIVFCIGIYLFTLAFHFLAKEEKVRSALKQTFASVKRLHHYIIPFLYLIVALVAVWVLTQNLFPTYRVAITVITIIAVSYFIRFEIIEVSEGKYA
jgi:hypothetical protein